MPAAVPPHNPRTFLSPINHWTNGGLTNHIPLKQSGSPREPVRKISYVKAFTPWGWIIGTGIYLDDIDKSFREVTVILGIFVLVIAVPGVGAGLIIAKRLTGPLQRLTAVTKDLSGGNLDCDLPTESRRDEIGDMWRALLVFRDNALERRQLEEARRIEEEREKAVREHALAVNNLSDIFERTVSAKVSAVEAASKGISITAQKMAGRSQQSGGRSLDLGDAATITTERAVAAAEATRQMSAAVIADAVREQDAPSQAGEVSKSVMMLAKASTLSCAGTVRVIWSATDLAEVVRELNDEATNFVERVRQ